MYTLQIDDCARMDLLQIFDDLSEYSENNAEKQLDKLESVIMLLPEQPYIGMKIMFDDQPCRMLIVDQYFVIYIIDEVNKIVDVQYIESNQGKIQKL